MKNEIISTIGWPELKLNDNCTKYIISLQINRNFAMPDHAVKQGRKSVLSARCIRLSDRVNLEGARNNGNAKSFCQ